MREKRASNREFYRQKRKEQYWKNPEKERRAVRVWQLSNPSKVRATYEKYYAEHADEIRAQARARHKETPQEKRIEEHRRWRSLNRERHRQAAREHAARYPDKIAARKALWEAVKKGKIDRGRCEVCGADRAQAHHDDYSKPFIVRWLCSKHHAEIHRKY